MNEHQKYKQDVENAINHVNDEHGTGEWRPIQDTNDSFSQAALARLYRAAKIGVVTPLRDGMNLVAKEYVAAQDPKDPGVRSEGCTTLEPGRMIRRQRAFSIENLAFDLVCVIRLR